MRRRAYVLGPLIGVVAAWGWMAWIHFTTVNGWDGLIMISPGILLFHALDPTLDLLNPPPWIGWSILIVSIIAYGACGALAGLCTEWVIRLIGRVHSKAV